MPSSSEPVFADVPDRRRYELTIDGELAGWLDYRDDGDVRSLLHAEVDRALEGHGLGGRLVGSALDDARHRGLQVVPYCSFVRSHLVRHADEYGALVPEDRRAELGLG